MFAYSPTPDRSGEILASGQMQAAQTNAQMMNQLGSDIGGALASIGGAYMEHQDMKSGVKSGEKLLDVMGPAIGMTSDKLKEFDYGNMSLRDKYKFHQGWLGNVGTLAQSYNFGVGNQTRQNQQALTARGQQITLNMPAARAQQNAASQVAAGQGRMTTLPANINPDVIP